VVWLHGPGWLPENPLLPCKTPGTKREDGGGGGKLKYNVGGEKIFTPYQLILALEDRADEEGVL